MPLPAREIPPPLRDSGSAMTGDSVAFFRDHRHELGPIVEATVTFPGFGPDERYPLMLRDAAGRQLWLSGCTAGYAGEGPRAAMEILVEAGFAPAAARAVFTHRAVRIARDENGATCLLQATGAVGAASVDRVPGCETAARLRADRLSHGITR